MAVKNIFRATRIGSFEKLICFGILKMAFNSSRSNSSSSIRLYLNTVVVVVIVVVVYAFI